MELFQSIILVILVSFFINIFFNEERQPASLAWGTFLLTFIVCIAGLFVKGLVLLAKAPW